MIKITQPDEDTLNAIAHELEQIAEELRNRGKRGRDVGTLADFPGRLSQLVRGLEGVALRR